MVKMDKLKSRLGLGSSWDSEYLEEGDPEPEQLDDYSGEQIARNTYAGLGLGVNSPSDGGKDSEKRYTQDSPFASGASPSAVKKHARKPDLQRAAQISGSELRDVEESRRLEVPPKGAVDEGRTFRPKSYSEASQIANRLKEGKAVTVDLTLVPASQRQRFIDFMAGLVYALDGHLARSSANIYVLTPR
ncbi:MAG: cell division protein SepF [Coriobacteriia bacterium]|nr:cell division protein SepF [Coriobacteriia bacterium]